MAKRLGKIRSKSLLIAALMMVAIGGIAFTVPNDRYFQVQKNLDIFVTMFKEVNAFYVDEVDPEKLISEGINAMLATLDPYTVYIPEEQAEDYLFMTTNEYGGIGTSISKIGDRVVIAYPRSGYPAAESGIQQGDQILEVDGQSIAGLTTQEISSRLKGRPGTKVSILVEKAEGSAKAYELTRRRITIDNVPYSGIVESGIGYIRISDFTTNTSREVKQAMETLKGQGAEALVIDLRGNPGGLLSEAINVSNLFIEKGREFKPDVIGISAGFDGYFKDKLLQLNYSQRVFYECAYRLKKNFRKTPVFAVLEGGYHPDLRKLVDLFVEGINKGKRPPKITYNEEMAIG